MQVVDYKTEAEWLELRKADVTSTESPALFGLSPYMTELELYHLKQSREQLDFKATDRMRWGSRMEKAIAEGVAEDLDISVAPLKNYQRIPDIRMGSSFDYQVTSGEFKGWLMEIKNVDFLIYRDQWSEDEAPEHIETQIQHQMEVAGRPGCLLVAMVGGNNTHIITRERDRAVGAALQARIAKFWNDIADNKEPVPDYEKDAEFIIGLHQSAGSASINMDGNLHFQELAEKYVALSEELKEAETKKKAAKAEMLEIIGNEYSKAYFDGYSISCSMTKDTDPTIITPEMVGTKIGGQKGYRNFRVTKKKGVK